MILEKATPIWKYFFCAFLVIYVLIFGAMQFFSYPSADDYYIANMVHQFGPWQGAIEIYKSLSSAFGGIFLQSLAISSSNLLTVYPYLSWITICFNLFSIYFLLNSIKLQCSVTKKMCLSIFFQALWFAKIPALNEVFYWLSGMHYTWTCTSLIFTAAFLFRVLQQTELKFNYIFLCFFVLITGISIHQTSVAQCAALSFLLLYLGLRREKKLFLKIFFVWLLSLGAFLSLFYAPGTAARMSGVTVAPAGHVLQALKVAVVFGSLTAVKFFASPVVYVLLLCLPDASKHVQQIAPALMSFLKIKYVILTVVAVAFFNQAIGGFALGTPLAPRGEGLTVWMMCVVWLFFWAFCYRNERLTMLIEHTRLYSLRHVILCISLLVSPNFISVIKSIPVAPLYAEEMQARYDATLQQKRQGKQSIFLPSLANVPTAIFYQDLTLCSDNYLNSTYSQFWNVKKTVCYPFVLQKEGVLFNNIEEVIATLKEASMNGNPEVLTRLGEAYDSIFPDVGDVCKNNGIAAKYYLMAAEKGYKPAQSRLIRVYATGSGVSKDYFAALKWLIRLQF